MAVQSPLPSRAARPLALRDLWPRGRRGPLVRLTDPNLPPRMSFPRFSVSCVLAAAPFLGGCSTIAGTAASPLTGGIDLCREVLHPSQWYWVPFVWIGGTVGAPFVAFYNGIHLDARGLTLPTSAYWQSFPEVFRPWDMLL